ncbi:MAG: RCC1 domain-containing protein [Candidatus Saccharimonadales bacterium]
MHGWSVQQVATSDTHSCAIADGKAYCWGLNNYGQLGDGTIISSLVPIAVNTSGVLAGKTLVQISVGYGQTCALDNNGMAYCWGEGGTGELGNGIYGDSYLPVAVDTSGVLAGKALSQIVVDAGSNHTCAIDTEGKAYCWGNGDGGELGDGRNDGGNTMSSTPIAVDITGALAGKTLTQILPGGNITCALDTDGVIYCWGSNNIVKTDTTYAYNLPNVLPNTGVLSGKMFTQMVWGDQQICALATDDKVYCWGSVNIDYLPWMMDTTTIGHTIIQLTTGGTGYNETFCAQVKNGTIYCWGSNTNGQYGDGTQLSSKTPVPTDTSGVLDGKIVEQISVSSTGTCAVTSEGKVYCWGAGSEGRIGNNSTISSYAPDRVHTTLDTSDLPTISQLPEGTGRTISVHFGINGSAAECTNVVVAIDGASLTCTTTAHIAGLVDVTIDDGVDTFVLAEGFEYTDIGVPNTGAF